MSRAAFLGLGLMGAPIARRLIAAGYDLALWNRSAGKAEALAGGGGMVCTSAVDAARGAALVLLCLTDGDAIEAVLFGHGGAAAAIGPGTTVVDFSTSSPARAAALARRLHEERGADWLDCPVSGGVAGAQAGTLVVMAGGAAVLLDRIRPVLAHVASRVTRMGGVGAGQAAKLCNQLIVSANLLAIAEAIALGEALGIDTSRLPAALAGGFADSTPLQLFGPYMASGDHDVRVGEIRTMAKDVHAALRSRAQLAAAPDLPLSRQVAACYDALIDRGLGGMGLPSLMRLYEAVPS